MSDISGLTELIADLTEAPFRARFKVPQVVEKSAGRVEADARRLISGVGHAPYYPDSITHDVEWEGTTFVAEVGPDKSKRQGALGNILEYGTSKNAPLAHLGPALDLEGPRFEKAIEELGGDLL